MTGNQLFAVIFIFTAMFGLYVCTALEFGVLDAIANKIVELVDAHINKQKKDT